MDPHVLRRTAQWIRAHDQVDGYFRPHLAQDRRHGELGARPAEGPHDERQVRVGRLRVRDLVAAAGARGRLAKPGFTPQAFLEHAHRRADDGRAVGIEHRALDDMGLTRTCGQQVVDHAGGAPIDAPRAGKSVLLLQLLHGQERRGAEDAVQVDDREPELSQIRVQEPDIVAARIELESPAFEFHGRCLDLVLNENSG